MLSMTPVSIDTVVEDVDAAGVPIWREFAPSVVECRCSAISEALTCEFSSRMAFSFDFFRLFFFLKIFTFLRRALFLS